MDCPFILITLFKQWSGESPRTIVPLPLSGSARNYFRIQTAAASAIGVVHADAAENSAFVSFARHFKTAGLPVPEVYLADLDQYAYLQQDLGEVTLFDLLSLEDDPGTGPSHPFLIQAMECLSDFQIRGHQGLDYSKAYPRTAFDKQSMRWDLNYFKYHFLKFTGVVFDEQKLENDFEALIGYLSKAKKDFFLYRDFQTRNIMVSDDRVWFIDFQGGRKGYPAYDVASLLFDAKANLSPSTREELLTHYLKNVPPGSSIREKDFRRFYPAFVLIRKLQAMGAFGFRGIFERKTHFLQSIPYALRNAKWIMENLDFPIRLPELSRILIALPDAPFLEKIEKDIRTLDL